MPVAKVLYKSLLWKTFQFSTSFLISILFARVLRSAVSAEFYSLSYLLALAVSCFTLGLDISLNYYLSRGELTAAAANRIILAVVILALIIGLPMAWLMYSPLRYPHIGANYFLLFSGLTISGGLFTSLSATLFTASGRNHVPAMIAFAGNLIVIAAGLAAAFSFTGSRLIDILFLVYFAISFLQGAVLFVMGMRHNDRLRAASQPSTALRPSPVPPSHNFPLKAILRFSLAAFLTNLVFYIGSRISLYLIPYWAPRSDQGNFFQAYKIVEYIGIAASFIYYPVIALVAGDTQGNMPRRVLLLVRMSNTFVLIVALLIVSFGWWAFPFIFGKTFDHMYPVLLGCIPGLFAAASSTFFTAYFFGRGKIRINFISACIQLASVLIFFFILVRPWGIVGAALAFSIAGLASFIYDCRAFASFAEYRLADLLFLHRSDIIALASRLGRGKHSSLSAGGPLPDSNPLQDDSSLPDRQ